MAVFYMLGLIREKLEVLYFVVARIAVNVMYDFIWFEVASKMFLHYEAMKQYILSSRWFYISWIRVIVWRYRYYIPIFSSMTSLPLMGFLFSHTIHRVIFAIFPASIHRVIFARYIPMVRRVCVCKITRGYSTTYRAETLGFITRIFPDFFSALGAFNIITLLFGLPGAFHRAILGLYGWIRFVLISAILAYSFHHRLNYTTGW